VGLAGASTAIAEGIDGASANAAAPAVRDSYSYDWFDYDIDVDASLPGAYAGTDFDNHGANTDPATKAIVNGFLYAHAGALVQFGQIGAAATAEFFQYGVQPQSQQSGVTMVYGRYHAQLAYGAANNQIVVGAGVRIVTLQVRSQGSTFLNPGQTLLTLDGAGPEVGAVFKPNGLPFRLGATVRAPVSASVGGVVGQVGQFFGGSGSGSSSGTPVGQQQDGYWLPSVATLPWEFEAGFALQLGPRPLNPAWLNPHDMEESLRKRIDQARKARLAEYTRELAIQPANERAAKRRAEEAREESIRHIEDLELDAEILRLRQIRVAREANWPRERITVVGSFLATGPSSNAVSLEGFATKTLDYVGRNISIAPRVGIESEPVANWVHARVGSYLEPSRFENGTARQHFTVGGDVKVFHFSPWGIFGEGIWRVNFSADLAPRYANYGLGFGMWH
jgi:hypothetical protein